MGIGDKYYTEQTRSLDIEGTPTDTVIQEASDGNVPGRLGMRSYRCVVCGLCFKEKDVILFRGKPYGKPCGCSSDIQSILREEHGSRAKTFRSDSLRR